MKFPTSGLITSAALGLDPAGIQDSSPILQAAIDGLAGPATFLFAPGLFRFSFPVLMGQYAPEVHGSGRTLTMLQTFPGGTYPIPVYGFRQVEQGNAYISAANRPDCLGVLDRSFTSAPGYALGFRTCGNCYGMAVNHPLAIGSRSSMFPGVCWSYWSEDPGFTLELAITFSGPPRPGPILGLGSAGSRPSPWFLSVVDGQTLAFGFKTNDMSPDWSTGQHYATFPLPPGAQNLYKIRIWIDWVSGRIGVACNGQPLSLTWNGHAPALAGLHFQRNRGQFAFFLGCDQDNAGNNGVVVPDFTLWGLRLSNLARTSEPANDGARYLDDFATIAYLPGTGPVSRWLPLRAGQAGYSDVNALWLVPATPMGHGIPGGSVEDLTIQDGSLLLGRVLDFAVRRCNLYGRYTGLHNLSAMEASYPVILEDVWVSGNDAAVSLQKCEVWSRNLKIQQGGVTGYRGIGGNNRLVNNFLAFPGTNAETAIELLPEQWGGQDLIDGFNCDNEQNSFAHSIIRKELSPYTNSSLRVRDLDLAGVSPGQPVIDLIGHPLQPGTWNPGVIDVRVVGIYSQGHGPVVNAGVNWCGTVSAPNLSGPLVTGPGASGIHVESTSPISTQGSIMSDEQKVHADVTAELKAPDRIFPTFVFQLADAPPAVKSLLSNIQALLASLVGKYGKPDWMALLMAIGPDLATGNLAKIFWDIVNNWGKIYPDSTASTEEAQAALRQHALFAKV